MQNHKISHRPLFQLTALAVALYLAQSSAFAMQELNETAMRQVNGQDGLHLNTSYDTLHMDKLYWEDKAGRAAGSTDPTLRAYAEGINITGSNLGTTYEIQTGTSSETNPSSPDFGKVGIDLNIKSRYGTISADDFKICDDLGNCDPSMGGLTVQSTKDAVFHFTTKDGLFSSTSLSRAIIALKHLNIYLTQKENATVKNQLILQNFNFNFDSQGYMYVDATKGLILETRDDGYVRLNRVCEEGLDCSAGMTAANSTPGLNIDFVMRDNVAANPYVTTGAKGMIRVGASGYIPKASLQFRGTNGLDTAGEAILGKAFAASNTTITPNAAATAIIGSTGLATRMYAEFSSESNVPSGETPTTLELAHGGSNAYGLSFSNFTPLLVRKSISGTSPAFNPDRAYFDTGNVYVNLADTKRMALPENTVLKAAPFMGGKLTTVDASVNDYSQLLHEKTDTNPRSLIIATRGTQFQALSRNTQFIASPDVYSDGVSSNDPVSGGTWALGLPIYNLNSNIALYGTTFTGTPYGGTAVANSQRLGFAFAMSTEGVSADGSKTTSIMLIDGKKYGQTLDSATGLRTADTAGDPINYYLGLRNIDMLIRGYGSIGFEGGRLNLNIPKFVLAAAGQLAVGYLPGSQYKTYGKGYAPINGFSDNKDVLFGLRLRMEGAVDMTMIPGGNTLASNYISFDGAMTLTGGAIQLVEPIDSSIVGLDNISGKIGFSNHIKINKDNVNFNNSLTINPAATMSSATEADKAAGVLRIKDLNFYPTGGTAQRLGEMAFTGGKINSQFNITPH